MAPRPLSHALVLAVFRALSKLHNAYASPSMRRSVAGFDNGHTIYEFAGDEPEEKPGSVGFWTHLLVSVGLVLAGGVFAGLTLGLMGLDELHLRVLATSSDDLKEKQNAKTVLKLLRRGRHWVLVVLLLSNVIINESLPIFLDSAIGGGVAAIVISTTMIFIFGEVIPQSICARYGLAIGARCSPFVLFLMYLFSPIAYPTAKLLDYVLGAHEGDTYKKAELKSFLQFHRHGEEPLRDDEIVILNGVLELNTKRVTEIMTPMKDVVTLSADTILDHNMVDRIIMSGYSRFPVHEPDRPEAFIGLLLVKKLLQYDPQTMKPVSSFPLSILPEASPGINCFQALDYFQTGRAHLLLISTSPGKPQGALGVVTLEDVIEEIISEEIVDETDRYMDNQSKRRAKRQTTAAVMQGIVERARRRGTASDLGAEDRSPLLAATKIIHEESILDARDISGRSKSQDNDRDSHYSWNSASAYGNERSSFMSRTEDNSIGRKGSDSDRETVKGGNAEGFGLLIDHGDEDGDGACGSSQTITADRGRSVKIANGRGNVPQYGSMLSESPAKS